MYKKVLTAVNEHLNSEVAAWYAMELARASGARLYVCFIAQRGLSGAAFERATEAVKRVVQRAEAVGVRVEAIVDTGEPVGRVEAIVRREGINLVFAATRKADIERRFYTGTVARKLSIILPCSVALVRVVHARSVRPREILLPLKERIDHTEERAHFAAVLARAFGSAIVVFHAPRPISRFFHGQVHVTPLEWERRLSPDIRRIMEYLGRHEVPHSGKAVAGRTGRTISLEALAKRHDLIIMGASERSLLGSIFKGNPVEEVLRDAPCDLIIFRPKA